jgi:CelD/BcsL family acetyltransferase involved in cellulose biosynthesis
MLVEVIQGEGELARLRDDWDAVYAADPEAQPFMSWGWISAWFQRLPGWVVLAVKPAAGATQYVGFLPLQLELVLGRDGVFHNVLRTGGGYFAGYTGFLCRPEHEIQAIAALAEATLRLNWSRLHLDNIHASPARLGRFLEHFGAPRFEQRKVERPDDGDGVDHDIYVYVDLPGAWDAFLEARLGAATRRTARRTLRAVDDGEAFRITHVTADSLQGDLDILLKFWENQWAAKLAARYRPALPYAMIRAYRHMLAASFAHDALFLPILWRGDRPVGAQATLIDHKNRALICLLGGRDLEVKKPAPGFALHLHSIRWAIRNGFTVYDLQTGDFAYKYDFGGLERRIDCLLLATADGRNLRDRIEPRTIPSLMIRAEEALLAGRRPEAEQACRQILAVDPAHPAADRLLAQIAPAPAAPAFNLAAQFKPAAAMTLQEQIRRATERKPGT